MLLGMVPSLHCLQKVLAVALSHSDVTLVCGYNDLVEISKHNRRSKFAQLHKEQRKHLLHNLTNTNVASS